MDADDVMLDFDTLTQAEKDLSVMLEAVSAQYRVLLKLHEEAVRLIGECEAAIDRMVA